MTNYCSNCILYMPYMRVPHYIITPYCVLNILVGVQILGVSCFEKSFSFGWLVWHFIGNFHILKAFHYNKWWWHFWLLLYYQSYWNFGIRSQKHCGGFVLLSSLSCVLASLGPFQWRERIREKHFLFLIEQSHGCDYYSLIQMKNRISTFMAQKNINGKGSSRFFGRLVLSI